ncbi:hypothetical protein JCM10207_006153 [Rhodosporidiobolus poonsookiae]
MGAGAAPLAIASPLASTSRLPLEPAYAQPPPFAYQHSSTSEQPIRPTSFVPPSDHHVQPNPFIESLAYSPALPSLPPTPDASGLPTVQQASSSYFGVLPSPPYAATAPQMPDWALPQPPVFSPFARPASAAPSFDFTFRDTATNSWPSTPTGFPLGATGGPPAPHSLNPPPLYNPLAGYAASPTATSPGVGLFPSPAPHPRATSSLAAHLNSPNNAIPLIGSGSSRAASISPATATSSATPTGRSRGGSRGSSRSGRRIRAPPPRTWFCDAEGCDRVFARPSALRSHQRTHSGVQPFVCPCCQRAFSIVYNLQRHMKTHPEIDCSNVAPTDLPFLQIPDRLRAPPFVARTAKQDDGDIDEAEEDDLALDEEGAVGVDCDQAGPSGTRGTAPTSTRRTRGGKSTSRKARKLKHEETASDDSPGEAGSEGSGMGPSPIEVGLQDGSSQEMYPLPLPPGVLDPQLALAGADDVLKEPGPSAARTTGFAPSQPSFAYQIGPSMTHVTPSGTVVEPFDVGGMSQMKSPGLAGIGRPSLSTVMEMSSGTEGGASSKVTGGAKHRRDGALADHPAVQPSLAPALAHTTAQRDLLDDRVHIRTPPAAPIVMRMLHHPNSRIFPPHPDLPTLLPFAFNTLPPPSTQPLGTRDYLGHPPPLNGLSEADEQMLRANPPAQSYTISGFSLPHPRSTAPSTELSGLAQAHAQVHDVHPPPRQRRRTAASPPPPATFSASFESHLADEPQHGQSRFSSSGWAAPPRPTLVLPVPIPDNAARRSSSAPALVPPAPLGIPGAVSPSAISPSAGGAASPAQNANLRLSSSAPAQLDFDAVQAASDEVWRALVQTPVLTMEVDAEE